MSHSRYLQTHISLATPLRVDELQAQTPYPTITATLLDRKITFMTIQTIIDEVTKTCQEGRKIVIASWNVHSFNLSFQLPWFYDFMQTAEIAMCDGSGILKTVNGLGLNLPLDYRATGTELIPNLLESAKHAGFSFFFLGAKPEILAKAISSTREKYSGVEINGYHGYFPKDDPRACRELIERINKVSPNILVIGMGMPLEEKWVLQNQESLDVNVIIPCGAVIDRLAGVIQNCPKWISDCGFEWLFRLKQEPRRLAARYLLGNPAFLLQIALAATYLSPLKVEDNK